MEPEKPSDGHVARRNWFPKPLWESDQWTVALLAVSALALIVLALALTGHLLGR